MTDDTLRPLRRALDLPHDTPALEVAREAAAARANNNYLRAVIQAMVGAPVSKQHDLAEAALVAAPMETLRHLESEFDYLREHQLTPTMASLIQAVHDAAGKGQEGEPIWLKVDEVEYRLLVEEEAQQEGAA